MQTPFQVDANTYVFGGREGVYFKMTSVDATGAKIEDRYTQAISTIDALDLATWEAATRGGDYSVEDFSIQDCPSLVSIKVSLVLQYVLKTFSVVLQLPIFQ